MPGKILNSTVEKYLTICSPSATPSSPKWSVTRKKYDVPIIGPACGRLLLTSSPKCPAPSASSKWVPPSAIQRSGSLVPLVLPAEVFYTDGDPKNAERARGISGVQEWKTDPNSLVGDALATSTKPQASSISS